MGWSTRKLITKAGEGGGRGLFGLGKSAPIINSSINKGMHKFNHVFKFLQYLSQKRKAKKSQKENLPFFGITLQSSSFLKKRFPCYISKESRAQRHPVAMCGPAQQDNGSQGPLVPS